MRFGVLFLLGFSASVGLAGSLGGDDAGCLPEATPDGSCDHSAAGAEADEDDLSVLLQLTAGQGLQVEEAKQARHRGPEGGHHGVEQEEESGGNESSTAPPEEVPEAPEVPPEEAGEQANGSNASNASAGANGTEANATNSSVLQAGATSLLLHRREADRHVSSLSSGDGVDLLEDHEEESEEPEARERVVSSRRRADNTFTSRCSYQMWAMNVYRGDWLNYGMSANECDDLGAYSNGMFNDMLSSGIFIASPGCRIRVYDRRDCTGPDEVMADAFSVHDAVFRNMNYLSDGQFNNKISSVKCQC